jgi:hypothetical protein
MTPYARTIALHSRTARPACRVRDGLIAECRDYMNGAALAEQLGRLPGFGRQ